MSHSTESEFPCASRVHHPGLQWSCPRCGISSKPGSWGIYGTPTRRNERMPSREDEKCTEFVSSTALKESMQESAIVWQRCGEQLCKHWEWMYGKQLGSYCNGPEEKRWCAGLGWWVWKWKEAKGYEKFEKVQTQGLREWLDLRNRESHQGCQVYDLSLW